MATEGVAPALSPPVSGAATRTWKTQTMRAFLLIEDDGEPVGEGVEFSDGSRVVKWLDGNMLNVYGAPVDARVFDEDAWTRVWVTGELTVRQLARVYASDAESGPVKVEGLAEILADLRTRPGLWKPLAVAEDELAAHALRQALVAAAEDEAPGEHFGFASGAMDDNPFTVFGSFEPEDRV
jgi:hypothetical protein